MKSPIFLSGPHGSGKTSLLDILLKKYEFFYESDFDIDFLTEFQSIKVLSHFERCLIRLYHRIYLTSYATTLATQKKDKVIVISRGIYDSAAYINTYKKLNWLSAEEANKLDFIIKNSGYTPYTIVLNPQFEVVKERLMKRRNMKTRKERDNVFKHEDSDEFIRSICNYFTSLRDKNNILYIKDNSEAEVQNILQWIKTIK